MKKILITVCFLIIFAAMAGCGMTDDLKGDLKEEMQDMKMTAIEAHEWDFSYGQRGSEGEVFIRSEDNDDYEAVKTADIDFLTDKGNLLIKDNKDKKEWQIQYKLVSENSDNSVYELSYGSGEEKVTGMATVSKSGDDDNEEDSLVITLGDYTLWFYD